MMTRLKLVATICLAVGLLVVVPGSVLPVFPPGDGSVAAGPLEEAQEELERVQRLIEQKNRELEQVMNRERSVARDITTVQRELDTLQGELRQLQGRIGEVEQAIAVAESEIADATVRLDGRTDLMLTRVRAMSETGYVNYLEVLLGARSFSDFLARFELLRQVLESDVELFNQVKEEKRQLEAKKAFLEEQRSELVTLRSDTTARKAAVQRKQDQLENLQQQLREDKDTIARALEDLEETSKELTKFIVAIQLAQQQSGERPVFAWPLNGKPLITSRYGNRFHPILKVWKLHTGIDLAAPSGTDIFASAPGQVILAGWAGGYGKCVIISHAGLYSTLYAHLSNITVRVNEIVVQGEHIGDVGSTGYSTGPHLHFEIRLQGEPIDPLGTGYLPPR